MKKFLKKYGYILLVVVIAAGCYTGFRAFRYYYHDTDDYCLRTYGTMARVEEKCGKTGLLHMENAGNWSSHDYWLKYPRMNRKTRRISPATMTGEKRTTPFIRSIFIRTA